MLISVYNCDNTPNSNKVTGLLIHNKKKGKVQNTAFALHLNKTKGVVGYQMWRLLTEHRKCMCTLSRKGCRNHQMWCGVSAEDQNIEIRVWLHNIKKRT